MGGCWAQREPAVSNNARMERLMKASDQKRLSHYSAQRLLFNEAPQRWLEVYCFAQMVAKDVRACSVLGRRGIAQPWSDRRACRVSDARAAKFAWSVLTQSTRFFPDSPSPHHAHPTPAHHCQLANS